MSIQKINQDDIELFTLETTPRRTFVSSSVTGITGTLNIFARRSNFEKEVRPISVYSSSFFTDIDIDAIRVATLNYTGSYITDRIGSYINLVHSQSVSARKQQTVTILRTLPTTTFTENTVKKSIIVDTLMPFYRSTYPESFFGYTNYHSLNFFTASNLPNEACLIYPDLTGSYSISSSFSFDFWINPRYTTDTPTSSFKAGTILHRSSSYAVTLLTGSSKDINGYPNGFKLMLQLSHSTDFNPSELAATSTYPRDLVFFSDDNALTLGQWHHVTIRWGSNLYNQGSGSFVVNGATKGSFVVPSASIGTGSFEPGIDKPNTLFIGNYFTANPNTAANQATFFFSNTTAIREGLTQLVTGSQNTPTNYSLNNPLNAELHDVKIYGQYLTNLDIASLYSSGPRNSLAIPQNSLRGTLKFYLPPFFTYESPYRTVVSGVGGIMLTPTTASDGTTTKPFNTAYSFGVAGHDISVENYLRDFATGNYPRLLSMTGSITTITNPVIASANEFLYLTGSNIKRLWLIMPNDNGVFYPNYNFLSSLSQSNFVNDLGNNGPGIISLRNLIPTSSIGFGLIESSGSLVERLYGASPTNLSGTVGNTLSVYHQTRDNSSNQVVMFDISNLYYGNYISPGSFYLKDSALTGSRGKVALTIRDDGLGNLYRADNLVSASTWNSVGNIFYNEGLIFLKSPHTYFLGKDQFEMSFKGTQNIHILSFNLMARPMQIVSSSNLSYVPVSASSDANDTDKRFVYITEVNIHDENLNVISRTSLSQPVVKRTGEKFLFRVRHDY